MRAMWKKIYKSNGETEIWQDGVRIQDNYSCEVVDYTAPTILESETVHFYMRPADAKAFNRFLPKGHKLKRVL